MASRSPHFDEALLRTEEVAALLRVHPKHVYRLLRRGLPGRRVGSEWRFTRGEVLAWAGRNAGAAAAPVQAEREAAAGAPPALVAANGDVVIEILLRLVNAGGGPLIGFVHADRATAIAQLEAGAVLAAGCHAGAFPTHTQGDRLARIHLVRREVGLVAPPGKGVPALRSLSRVRLASRPATAGIRQYLDDALRAAGLDPERVHQKALLLSSHQEVACAVAAGSAGVGLASRAWGERVGLGFARLADEPYGLLVRARDLGDPRVVQLCEVAQSPRFRELVDAVPGYDAAGAGEIKYDAAAGGSITR